MEEKTYFFPIARLFMELTTIWYPKRMTETSRKVYKILAYFLKGNYYLFVTLFIIGILTTDSEADRDLNLQYLPTLIAIAARMWLLQTKKIKDLYSEIYDVEKRIASEENQNLRNIFFDDVKYNKNLTKLIIALNSFTNIQLILFSMYLWLELKNVLFTVVWYPFDSYQYIDLAALHQTLSSAYTFAVYLALNITIVPLILFATTRLKLLCYKFEHFKQFTDNIGLSPKDYLSLLIEEHQDIISYVVSVNHSMKWCFIVDFMLKSYTFTQYLYTVLKSFNEDRARLGLALFAFIVVSVEIWYISYHGNELILVSQELSKCIFANNNWYELDIGLQNDLLMIMVRSERPLSIVVGNFYTIDNNLFLKIMKAGYTFLLFYNV
ncbi:unnamed protein product [Phyllotreta striolata]|uniref:Odorant receptor n=1 Tax=Phyllotreta striolata TaxID=444603 RepID=A0A9N9XL42_PHYSR|nr:unnamed protein product [Phyllotreta striolata]